MSQHNLTSRENCECSDEILAVSRQYVEKVRGLLIERYNDKLLFAHVRSYGCQQNTSDGEKIMGLLALMGYSFTDTPEGADIVIYNTCAVRENAELKVYGNIGELKHTKENRPDMLIGLCGCMVQQEHIAEKIKKSYPQVDLVFGTHVINRLPELIYNALINHKRQFDLEIVPNVTLEDFPVVRDKAANKANLPIMYGCNNFCTYCVVPYVRGRERSRKSDKIVAEMKQLIAEGYKEITLLGQNVNSYGKGLDENIDFSKLLRKLNNIDGDFRIRFMSSHPKDATFELIDAIADCDKVCKHFHLPVQSGSNRILSLMNRNYTDESYMKLINYARGKISEISFTSDIIVGFPGETEEDFEKTLLLVENVGFDSTFSFIYSKRVGTKAADMVDCTSYDEKSNRFSRLMATQKVVGHRRYDDCVGKTYKVLVESAGRTSGGFLSGRNDGYMIIDFKGDKNLIGEFVNVKITASLGWALIGEII